MKQFLFILLSLFQIVLARAEVNPDLLQKAESGDANAMYQLALYYLEEKDVSHGLEWLKKSAEKGYPDAVNDIGLMYCTGVGVPLDYEIAEQYFNYAASLGSYAGKYNAEHIVSWAESDLFYDEKNIPAMIFLGSRYFYGIDTEINYKKAYELYSKADNLGDNRATTKLGQMYYYGYYVEQDYNKAFDLLIKASIKNPPQSEAMQLLSTCYRFGFGTEKDIDKAELWLNKAAEAGDISANSVMSLLGNDSASVRIKQIEALAQQERAHKDSLIASADIPTVDLLQIGNDTIQVGSIQIVMIGVQGGTFNMGADIDYFYADEARPIHAVTVSSFYMAQTEVTQELWYFVMKNNPSYFKGEKRPVECVSWDDCQAFISKLNAITGKKFRLPTEAEWEFAARGGNKTCHNKLSGGAVIDANETEDVASELPNYLDIYDMSGNVNELCYDNKARYTYISQVNPLVIVPGEDHIYRGGSYGSMKDYYISRRSGLNPNLKNCQIGFRLAMSRDGN